MDKVTPGTSHASSNRRLKQLRKLSGEASMNNKRIVYERPLPGGGFVHVEEDGRQDTDTHRARVAVERRADPVRREGHEPPVIAHAEGKSSTTVFGKLLAIARDNVEIARGLLRLGDDGKAKF
jgi:hypothetical protein